MYINFDPTNLLPVDRIFPKEIILAMVEGTNLTL